MRGRLVVKLESGGLVQSRLSDELTDEESAANADLFIDLIGGHRRGASGHVKFDTDDGWMVIPLDRVVFVEWAKEVPAPGRTTTARAIAAALISDAGDFASGETVEKHWTEYGPTYVACASKNLDEATLRLCVQVLGWETEMWDFPPLDEVIGS